MGYKKLISPDFRITTEKYELSSGIEVKCFSSRSTRADWCTVALADQYSGLFDYDDMERASVELGYDDDYDLLMDGYCRKSSGDSWKELLIRDAVVRLEQAYMKATFVSCTPQDVVRYVLTQAGIEEYHLSDTVYGMKDIFVVDLQNGLQVLEQINSAWGISCDFFFRADVFYWDCRPEQDTVYVLEEDENILSLQLLGSMYEVETLGVPWIHHSQELEIAHSQFSGTVTVEKTMVKRDDSGHTRMYIDFKGG